MEEGKMSKKSKYNVNGNIGLTDADLLDNGTRHPNLALMKLSGFFKANGHTVKLLNSYTDLEAYDKIYISKVFKFTNIPEGVISLPNIEIGGTGFFDDGGDSLPDVIEHHMPDYSIYADYIEKDTDHLNKASYWGDYLDYSIGFASRGCFRKCEFCVNNKYDKAEFHSHIKEWLDPNRKGIYLWDDNIFAYSGWRDVFKELAEIGKPFQFRQGLDIRLLTDEKAEVLKNCKYKGDIIFAFDHIEEKEEIEKKLILWRKHCHKSTKLYVLAGFDSQDEKEIESVFERISIIIKYGCLPYIMRHEYYLNSPYKGLFIQIARWCNQPQFFKKKSFREFCQANQDYRKTDGYCSSMVAMMDFEEKFPEITEKYFDMRFDQQEYMVSRKNTKSHPEWKFDRR